MTIQVILIKLQFWISLNDIGYDCRMPLHTYELLCSTVRLLISVLFAVFAAALVLVWLFALSCLSPLLGTVQVRTLKSSLLVRYSLNL